MPYVQRDEHGEAVLAVFENLQPGFAEEFLDDEDADIVAFLNPLSTALTVDAEKERRLELGMDYYNPLDETTYTVQIRDRDMLYIISMATFALDRRENYPSVVVPGYLQWLDFTTDFAILDITNTSFNLDAFEVQFLMLNMAIARHSIITTAQNLKTLTPIPSDYNDDSRWPPLPTGGRS